MLRSYFSLIFAAIGGWLAALATTPAGRASLRTVVVKSEALITSCRSK